MWEICCDGMRVVGTRGEGARFFMEAPTGSAPDFFSWIGRLVPAFSTNWRYLKWTYSECRLWPKWFLVHQRVDGPYSHLYGSSPGPNGPNKSDPASSPRPMLEARSISYRRSEEPSPHHPRRPNCGLQHAPAGGGSRQMRPAGQAAAVARR